MRPPCLARSAFAALATLIGLQGAACFRDPDPSKMKCIESKGCPPGYQCVSTDAGGRCQEKTAGADVAPSPRDLANAEALDSRADLSDRDGTVAAGDTNRMGDSRGQEAAIADVPVSGADVPAIATDANLGSDGAAGSGGTGGASTGTGGTGGILGTGGATSKDAGPADVSDTADASEDGGRDVPVGSGGANTGGSGGMTGTGGASGGSSGTGGASGDAGSGGASTGGASTGGAGVGGTSSGGVGTGGASTGGTGTGGATGSGGATCAQGGDLPANALTIQVDQAQAVVNKELFGVLMERLGKQFRSGLFVGTESSVSNTNGMRNDIIDGLKEAGVGAIQFPGGCVGNSYPWSTTTAPADDVGTDRFMELCNLVGAEPYLTGLPDSTQASSNVAWVNYVQSHPGWGLKYFKVGSEVWGCGGFQTEAIYESNYTANYNALKDKGLFLVASGGLVGNWTWYETMLSNIGNTIDGIEFHDTLYFPKGANAIPSIGFTVDQYYKIVNLANEGKIHPDIKRLIQALDSYDPAKRIKIVLDEWGDWLEPIDGMWQQQNTVMDAISAAEQLHLFIEHADRIQLAGLAQAINVLHSLFLTNDVGALVKTPTFYVFKMFIPHHSAGAKSAPKTLVSEDIETDAGKFPVLSAGATVDSTGRVNVSLVNVDLMNARTIQITLDSSTTSYAVSNAQIITGPDMDSFNGFGAAEIVNIKPLASSSYSICGKSATVTLPPKSVVMLAIDPRM